jgi:glutaryl-CoA dehydrogenase
MAALEKLGTFALTEPLHGSDSVALETSARRDGDEWVINGQKKWIGNGTLAEVVVVWARDVADQQVKGFLLEKGTPGYEAARIDGKGALRAVWQAEITLTDLRPGRPPRNGCSDQRSECGSGGAAHHCGDHVRGVVAE